MRKIIYLLGVTLFISCSSKDSFFYENKEFEDALWSKDNIIDFDVEIVDIDSKYNIYIDLRNDGDYPYSNLFLFAGIYKDTSIIRQDTLQYIMATPDGRWLGQGITNIKKSIFLYDSEVKFDKEGIYNFKLQQGMRKEELEGVVSTSLILEKI